MKRIKIEGSINSWIVLTGDVIAMYSPQPLTIENERNRRTRVSVSSTSLGGRSVTEERSPKDSIFDKYESRYDISRMAQLCCDADSLLGSVRYDGTPTPTAVRLAIVCSEWDGAQWLPLNTTPIYVQAMYAACDAMEKIDNSPVRRRIWVNYPSTVQCTAVGNAIEVAAGSDIYVPVTQANSATYELDWLEVLKSNSDSEYPEVMGGKAVTDSISYQVKIEEGQGEIDSTVQGKGYTFVPDTTPFGRGVYLRWLNRDGSVGYWLFTKSKEVVASTVDKSYSEFIEGVEAAPEGGILKNHARVDYDMSESWTIGTKWVEEPEYERLKGLTVSPIVEMLVGGTKESPIWQRVVVAAGSYTREMARSGLRRMRDFELVITLPEKNTIKL